jgi:hypothetical protein
MATPHRIVLSPKNRGIFSVDEALTPKAADKASEVLQENHERHHIFFKEGRFHSTQNP